MDIIDEIILPSSTSRKKRRRPNDKIFDNAYNKGEIELENLGVPTVDYGSSLLTTTYTYDDFRQNELYELLYQVYDESGFSKCDTKETKFLKKDLLEIFSHLSKPLLTKGYSYIEVFTSIAEFLSVDYKMLYETVPNSIKTPILKECGDKFTHIQVVSSKKLF